MGLLNALRILIVAVLLIGLPIFIYLGFIADDPVMDAQSAALNGQLRPFAGGNSGSAGPAARGDGPLWRPRAALTPSPGGGGALLSGCSI